jgi:hypothetical protein
LVAKEKVMIDREAVLQTLGCSPSEYPHILDEKFPHILEKIVELWNSPDCGFYLSDLLQPNGRGGGRLDRDGFPEEAWEELLQLNQLYLKPRP